MEPNNILLQIHEAIFANKLEKALDLLDTATSDKEITRKIILLKRRLTEMQEDELFRRETKDTINVEETSITSAILLLAEKVGNHEEDPSQHHFIHIIEEMVSRLEVTHNVYIAQCKIRNKLIDELKSRFDFDQVENYYQVFSKYYDEMNERELRYHQIIRGYTENIMRENNFEVLQLIQENPELKEKIPRLKDLEFHLILWTSKYKSIFEPDESISLVYIGVEEGVRFPSGIEHDLRKYLTKVKK